jgi:type I restriction enzyme M protein
MYEKLLHRLVQLLHGSMVPDEYYPVAFQLLAWARVSSHGRLPRELAFEPAEPPRDAKHLATIFTQISESGSLGADSNAFVSVSPAMQRLSRAQVLQALEIVASSNLDQPWDAKSLTATMTGGLGRWFAGLPPELTSLMSALARLQPSMSAYIAFEQSFQLTAAVQESGATTFSETRMTWPFPWLMNLLSDTSANIYVGDSLERPGFLTDGLLTQFDVALGFPPFGVKYDSQLAERDLYGRFPKGPGSIAVFAVRHLLARAKERAVIAVPNGLLFSPGAERYLRDDLLAKRQIEAVIGLPAAILPNTALPFSLIVLNPNAICNQIVFVDGTDESMFKKDGKGRAVLSGWARIAASVLSRGEASFARAVSVDDVINNDSQLQVTRYCKRSADEDVEVLLAKYPTRMLAELVTVLRPLPGSGGGGTVPVLEVGPADFPEFGYANVPRREILISEAALAKGQRQFLRPLDIAITIKGSVGKVGIFPPTISSDESGRWMAGQSCLVLRVNEEGSIDARVLFSFLKSEIGQAQLNQIVSGAAVPLIQLRELERIRIPIPESAEQEKMIDTFEKIVEIERLVASYRKEQRQLSNSIWAQ